MQQATGQPAHPRGKATKHVLGQSRSIEDLAHPDEQGQGREGPAARAGPNGSDHRIASRARGEQLHPNKGNAHQGKADPDGTAKQGE